MTKTTHPSKGIFYDSLFDHSDIPTEEIVEPHSFRNNLIRALCYTAVVPIFMLGFFQLQQFQRAMQTADQAQLAMAQGIADSSRLNVESIERILQVLVDNAASGTQPARLQKNLNQLIKSGNEGIGVVGIFDKKSQPLALAYSDHNLTASHRLKSLLDSEKEIANGTTILVTDLPKAITFVSVVTKDKEQSSGITATALVSTAFLDETLSRVIGDRKFNAVIYDRQGEEIASLYQSNLISSFELTEEQKNQVRLNPEGLLIRTPGTRAEAQIRAYIHVPRLNWLISVSQPLKVRDQSMMASAETSGFFLIIAVILTLLTGFTVNRPLTRSVNSLTDAVETFRKTGRFKSVTQTLEKDGITELIELGTSFERMVNVVNESKQKQEKLNAQLEEQVAERTSTLLSRNAELLALQRLLLPMQSENANGSLALKSHVSVSVEQFRVLLGLSELKFVSAEEGTLPEKELYPMTVELSGKTYGWLIAGKGTVFTLDRVSSLRRLANSLAIVLANNALVTQLATEHDTLTAVFESMTDGVVILGRSGKIIYANEFACRLLNDGKPLIGLYGRQHIDDLYERAVPEELTGQHTRLVRRTKKATTQIIDVVGFVVAGLPGFSGERRGWLIRDISREAGIDAMKENLVSVVAHELKTPVTALRLLTETVKRDSEAQRPSSQEDAQELMDETLRLGQLIDDILDVSRIEGGAMKLEKHLVQVASLVDRATRLAKARYPIRVERNITEEAEVMCVDPLRMTQVFINLFINAARYRKPDQPFALCRVDVSAGENNTVVIKVTDHGRGIESERLAQIFEPFYQADMTTKRASGGAGLGLTIVKGITEAHDGEVRVQSVFGASTTFTITIPA